MPRNSAGPDYDARLNVAVPRPLSTAVATAAAASMTTINAYCRGALLAKLRADGVKVIEENEAA
jgi:hypothetical protein